MRLGLMARRSPFPLPEVVEDWGPTESLDWHVVIVALCGSGGMRRRWTPWLNRRVGEVIEYRPDRNGD